VQAVEHKNDAIKLCVIQEWEVARVAHSQPKKTYVTVDRVQLHTWHILVQVQELKASAEQGREA
jgi:hypothetical protein